MNALVIGYGSIGKRHCRLLLAMGFEIEDWEELAERKHCSICRTETASVLHDFKALYDK